MKRVLAVSALALVATLTLSACLKVGSTTTINNDATAGMTFKFSFKADTLEKVKAMAEQFGGGGDDSGGQLDEAMGKINEVFDEKKMSANLEKNGLKVVSAKSSEKEGWKIMELEATCENVNTWIEKASKEADEKLADTPFSGMGLAGTDGGMMVPRFYKTETAGVGQVVIIPKLDDVFGAMGENPLEMLDNLGEEELEQAEMVFDMMKQQFSLDEMSMEFSLKLPGAIVATKGCKKTEDNLIVFTLKGSDMTLDGAKGLFGLREGVNATFQIPEDCKITFADAPKAAAKKAGTTPGGEEGEKKEKKGGLKIGEEEKKGDGK